jgi:O-antigen/teichoic acid export membrane protein
MLLLGSLYITTLLTRNQDTSQSLLAWAMFSIGAIINFYFGYINAFLQGRGDISQGSKVTVFSRGSMVFFSISALVMGYGLLGLGVASLVSAAVGRATAHRYFTWDVQVEQIRHAGITAEGKRDILRTLWHNAGRLGAVQIGAFLIQRGNVLIAASFVGLAASGSYGITMTVLMALSGMASVICQLQLPHLASLQAAFNRKAAAEVLGETFLMSWIFFLLGLTVLVAAGNQVLTLIGSRNHLLPWPLCLMLGIVILLEMNHSIAASYLTTLNKVPFVSAALISGVGVTLLTLLLIKPFGIAGMVAAQGMVQLAYNNWKWPMEAVRHLETSLSKILVLGARKIVSRYV